jgi:hypothetical protein
MVAKASQAATGKDVFTLRKAVKGGNDSKMARRAVAA